MSQIDARHAAKAEQPAGASRRQRSRRLVAICVLGLAATGLSQNLMLAGADDRPVSGEQISSGPDQITVTAPSAPGRDDGAQRSDLARDTPAPSAGPSQGVAPSAAPAGIIDAQPHRFRLRPAPGGISVGHFKITAGTLGCLTRGRTAPRNSRVMILSNNHVLANVNSGAINDCICQPGPYDGGTCPADQVAVLESFVRINFGGATNDVDCATGWTWHERVRPELVYLSGGAPQYFRVSSSPTAPAVGMLVGKSGRTTQLTRGQITAVGVAVNVNYGAAGVAHFKDQMSIVKPGGGDFSQGGDSGSLIWQWDSARRPVGLLFAGGGGTTFANRITSVLDALAVNLWV